MVTPNEIRQAVDAHKAEIAHLRRRVEAETMRLRAAQAMCAHPRLYRTLCMGDSGTRCPDCDHAT